MLYINLTLLKKFDIINIALNGQVAIRINSRRFYCMWSKFLALRGISADSETENIILKWMQESGIAHRCFSVVLESIGLKRPFQLVHYGTNYSKAFVCVDRSGKTFRVELIFDDPPGENDFKIQIADEDGNASCYYVGYDKHLVKY